MTPKTIWILIANGGEAQVFQAEERGGDVVAVDGMTFSNDIPTGRDVYADRQGRSFDRMGQGRHAMERTSDPAEQSELNFARQLSETLHSALGDQHFDELSVVAAPSMLANLRRTLSPQVRATIRAEVDKDYTKVAKVELADMLRRCEAIE